MLVGLLWTFLLVMSPTFTFRFLDVSFSGAKLQIFRIFIFTVRRGAGIFLVALLGLFGNRLGDGAAGLLGCLPGAPILCLIVRILLTTLVL